MDSYNTKVCSSIRQQSYKELCTAAKAEEKCIVELHCQQQYHRHIEPPQHSKPKQPAATT